MYNRKIVILSVLIIVLSALLTACSMTKSNPDLLEIEKQTLDSKVEFNNEEVPLLPPAEQPELKILSGTIYDATMNQVSIITEDGQIYEFDKSHADIKTPEHGMRIGYPIRIDYTGELDASTVTQKVDVQKVTVTDLSELDPAEQAYHRMMVLTLEEKVGQMFTARVPESDAVQKISDYKLGGYILFGRDFEGKSKEQVISTIDSYQKAAPLPMLIGVDEEGGIVNRVSRYPEFRATPFQSPQALYAEGGWEKIISDTVEKSQLLHELGINLNFAPVADVSTNPADYMYSRSFGKEATATAEYVETVVKTMKSNKMGVVLKHFPGYGNNEDTHTGLAYDNRAYETFVESDFVPFQKGIESGADSVLVAHNIVNAIDKERPASLSPKVHQILREDLGFEGVIVTDDLYMDGVKQFAQVDEVAVLAVLAGNDLLCCTDFEVQIPAVISAVKEGKISEEQINESVMRILKMKIELGILLP